MKAETTLDDLLKKLDKMQENIKDLKFEDLTENEEKVTALKEESRVWKAEAKAAEK